MKKIISIYILQISLLVITVLCYGCRKVTPIDRMMTAILSNDTVALKKAIKDGANVNIIVSRTDGFSVLQDTVVHGKPECVKVLLDNGANTDYKNKAGQTAMHQAAYAGKTSAMKLLIKYGAEIDSRNNNGDTPLICAASSGKSEIVKILIKDGADTSITDDLGRTARYYAKERGHKEIAELLEQ